jgi:hypothetical protein
VRRFTATSTKARSPRTWVSDPTCLRGCGDVHIQHNQIVGQRGYFDQLSFFRLHDLQVPARYPEA